ncbi:D-alanyl-D-alanine carboxypeptidase family protein [Agromyces cerinus]|uniref:D-alanyl-D-alanine carboxypeptidase (Penicillin-binding protein 5/6) n=1 Tax=Agromyces cerinus subsp. cerinus TaxID=232089 RepID=A0A1N6DYA4_9MICO|nr:D-alanyl-D-alanine carboxypeptidase [Agromyces cerinus]SIN75760.1 D-alanyl-D-alanine carboxypeptidase (penicillin-binding protein 5/6) [Agromyces cerinus subsp. cerinus]
MTDLEAQAAKAKVYRRRRIVVFSTLAVVIALLTTGGVYTANALGAAVPAAAPQVTDPEPVAAAPQQLSLPGFGAYAVGAVGFDGLLATGNESTPMPMASITKVITALTVLAEHPIPAGESGPDIEYTDADVDIYWDMVAQNGSVAPVEAGATLSLKESLEALLIPSGNNYGISIANWAFGSEQALVEKANAWLAANGLANTHVVDSSGISDDNLGTAADMVLLGEIALRDPTIAAIVASKSVDIPEIGTLKNSNKLLGTHGVDGMKTGTTDDAANLLFTADYAVGASTVTVVGVLLGGENHSVLDEAIAALLDSVAPGFHEVAPLEANQVLAEYTTPWGETARARTADGATVVVWSDTPVDVEVQAEPVTLAERGEQVGTAIVRAGTQEISVPLVLDAGIDDPGTWWRLSNPGALD